MKYASSKELMFCWPWTGTVVNTVNEPDIGDDFGNTEYWMKRFSNFKPEAVELLMDDNKQSVIVLVRFNTDCLGYMDARDFEKPFVAANHGKKEWIAYENPKGSGVYAWVARADDFESQGMLGDYLRNNRELKSIAGLVQEALDQKSKVVMEIANRVDMIDEELDGLQIEFDQIYMSLGRIVEEKDSLHEGFFKEARKISRSLQEHVKVELDGKKNLKADFQKQDSCVWKRTLDIISKLDEEIQREKVEALKKFDDLKIQKAKLLEMKLHGDEDDSASAA